MKESGEKIDFKDLNFGKPRSGGDRITVKRTADAKAAIKIALSRLNKKAMVRRAIGAARPMDPADRK